MSAGRPGGQYRLQLRYQEFVGTLAECWREAYGLAGVDLVAPGGRVLLRNAGSVWERSQFIAGARARNRRAHR